MKTTDQQMKAQLFEQKNTNGTWYFKQIKGNGNSGLSTTDPIINKCIDIHISVNCDSMNGDNISINTPHVTFVNPGGFMGAGAAIIHVYYGFEGENTCKYIETKIKASDASKESTMNSNDAKSYDFYADNVMRIEATGTGGWGASFTPSGNVPEDQKMLLAKKQEQLQRTQANFPSL
jgi:hypothetical protein